MHVHAHICPWPHMPMYMHAHTYTCPCPHMFVTRHAYTYMPTHMYTHAHACPNTCMHMCAHAHIHLWPHIPIICMTMHMHVHIHEQHAHLGMLSSFPCGSRTQRICAFPGITLVPHWQAFSKVRDTPSSPIFSSVSQHVCKALWSLSVSPPHCAFLIVSSFRPSFLKIKNHL